MTSKDRPSLRGKQQRRVWQSEQWWKENQEIFQHLYEGRSVKEIAQLVGRSERQVKAVKKQLDDLRTVSLSPPVSLNIIKYLPHPRVERPPEVLAAFERLMQQIEQEQQGEESDVIRDASTNLDKYIYG